MVSQAECVVSGPMAWALQVSKFVGLAPLRFAKTEKGWRVALSPSFYKFSCLIAILSSGTTIWSLTMEWHRAKVRTYSTITQDVARGLDVFLGTMTWAVMVYKATDHLRCIMTSLNRVRKITSDLKINCWSPQWKKMLVGSAVVWMLVCLVIIIADAAIIFVYSSQTKLVKLVLMPYFLYNWATQVGIMVFVLLVLHVKHSFKSINYCLNSILRGYNVNLNPRHETIGCIASAFASACDVVRDVDRCYGPTLMVFLAGSFMHLVATSYFFVVSLVGRHKFYNMNIFVTRQVFQFFWIVFYAINLVAVIEPCHLTCKEVEYTSRLVAHLMQHASSVHDPLTIELEQFCRQLSLNDVSYRPLNIVTLGRRLVLAILGSITTYLVILVDIEE